MALNVGELFIQIKANTESLNRAIPSIDKLEKSVRDLSKQVEKFSSAMEKSSTSSSVIIVNNNQKIVNSFNRISNGMRRTADRASKSSKRIIQAYSFVKGSIKGLVKSVFNLKNAFLITAAGFGLQKIVKTTAAFEGMQAALFAVTGDTKLAAEEFDFIRRQANRLGLDFQTLAKQYTDLSATTKGTQAEGALTKQTFLAIAESARVLSLDQTKVRDIFLAVQQMFSKGTVQAEELRRQLSNNLPGAFAAMAEAFAKSTGNMEATSQEKMAALEKAMKDGSVKTLDVMEAFNKELIAKFGPGLDLAVTKAQAVFQRLRNSVTELENAIGRAGLLDVVKELADEIRRFISPLTSIITQIGPDLKEILTEAFQVDTAKNYFKIVQDGLISLLSTVRSLVPIVNSITETLVSQFNKFSKLLPNREITEARDRIREIDELLKPKKGKADEFAQTLKRGWEKLRQLIPSLPPVQLDPKEGGFISPQMLDQLVQERERLVKVVEDNGFKLNIDPISTDAIDKLIASIREAQNLPELPALAALDFMADGSTQEKSLSFFEKIQQWLKDNKKEIRKWGTAFSTIFGQLGSIISTQLSALEELASFYGRVAQEALSSGQAQSQMWMDLADTVRYSNNQQAQAFEDKAVAVANASAQEFRAAQTARERANAEAAKAFENQKNLQVAQAIMSTATAAVKALADFGPIAGPAFAAAMTALGAIQIGTIRSQRYTPREHGGPITGGKPYLVGEAGPELIVPGSGGTVVNNRDLMSGLGGGGDIYVNFAIQANDTKDFDRLLVERRSLIINMMRQATNNQMRKSPV